MKKEIDVYIPKKVYGWVRDEKYHNTTYGHNLQEKSRIIDLKGKFPMFLYNSKTGEIRKLN